jgi:predicted  nucleic acid-binding Zn-ribbon protein
MREQLLLLVELQNLDRHLAALAEKKQRLPLQVQFYEAARAQEELQLERLHAEVSQGERQQRSLERELTECQGALAKTQTKLREVKTNKEYSAVLTEVAAAKERITTLEDHVLQLMEQTEQQRHTIRAQEERVREARQRLEEQNLHVQAAQEAISQDIANQQAQRHKTTAALDATLYTTYQQLATRHGGRALAHVQDGVCAGCHLRISPQLVADIRLQQKLYTCPHCRLLLVYLD